MNEMGFPQILNQYQCMEMKNVKLSDDHYFQEYTILILYTSWACFTKSLFNNY